MGESAMSGLNVAIICSRKQYLTQGEYIEIFSKIKKQIISDAYFPQEGTERPTFKAEPLFEDGAIKLWCGNVYTLTWLKETVRKLSLPSHLSLEVKSQSEVQKRTLGKFTIPDLERLFKGREDVMRTLCYQNPSIDLNRLEVTHVSFDNPCGHWNVHIMFPEDKKRALENAGCKFSIGLTAVKVQFDK